MKMSKITLVVASSLVPTIAGLLVDKAASFSVEEAGTSSKREMQNGKVDRTGIDGEAAKELIAYIAKQKEGVPYKHPDLLAILTKQKLAESSITPILSKLAKAGKLKRSGRGIYKVVGGE